jgi:hypothetical protein
VLEVWAARFRFSRLSDQVVANWGHKRCQAQLEISLMRDDRKNGKVGLAEGLSQ